MIDFDKATAYANALDSDIAAEPWQQVRDGKLTEWEAGFVDSIRHRLEKEQPLSA